MEWAGGGQVTTQKGSVPVGEGLAPAGRHPCSRLHFTKGAGASQEACHRKAKIQTAFWKVPSEMPLMARVEVGRQRGCRTYPSRGDSTGPGSGWQQEESAGRRQPGAAPGAEVRTVGTRRVWAGRGCVG